MRQILLGDLAAAARVVMGLPGPAARDEVRTMLAQAHLADCWRKRTGRAHPRHGDGSLMAVAMARRPPPEPFAGDAAFLAALGIVIAELRRWRDRRAAPQPAAQLTQRRKVGSSSRRRCGMASPQSSQ